MYRIFIALFVLSIATGAYFYFARGEPVAAPELEFAQTAGAAAPQAGIAAAHVPRGWRLYRNDPYDFSVFVPPNLVVREYDEGGGAQTIVFEDETSAEGFQVFVLPYDGETITEERFLQDAPSGVMREPLDVLVGGVPATAFFGEQSLMGETREVWFIRGGLLFEVTTYKQLDAWLAEIMDTWRFSR
jgi:hypothetical protein